VTNSPSYGTATDVILPVLQSAPHKVTLTAERKDDYCKQNGKFEIGRVTFLPHRYRTTGPLVCNRIADGTIRSLRIGTIVTATTLLGFMLTRAP
jgi:hypothetical protein